MRRLEKKTDSQRCKVRCLHDCEIVGSSPAKSTRASSIADDRAANESMLN